MRLSRLAVALLLVLLSYPALAAITGTVMNADGQPVAGARVMIHAIETPSARRERLLSPSPQLTAIAETKSDAKGAFSLPSPKEPVVDLRVELRGYEPETRRVEKDEELGAFLVTARDMKSGTITSGGKPVANATVVISYNGAEYVARTDEQGRYEAPEPRRARTITVIHPGFAIDEENFIQLGATVPASELTRTLSTGTAVNGKVTSADGKTPVDKAVITIDNWPVATSAEDGSFTVAHAPSRWTNLTARKDALMGQHAFAGGKPLTVRMERAATISGRILDTKTKVPVAGATVRGMTASRRFTLSDIQPLAITDAKGVYSIPVPAGTFMLSASHPAYEIASADVTVTAGQNATRDLNLSQLARVSGVVVDEEGRGVVGARVRGENAGMDMMRMMMFRDSGAVVTGTDGRFALRLRGDSDMLLRAAKKGLPDAKGDTIRLQPGERKSGVVLTMPSGIAVTGRVVDPNGKALSGVAVTASETQTGSDRMMRRMIMPGMPGEEEDAVRTASDGSFTIRLKEGTYDFSFKREGFAPKAIRAQNVATSGMQAIEARMEVAAEISGRVVRGGVGVPDVFIGTFNIDSSAVTGPDGSFTLSGLAAGTTRLSLRNEDALINEQRSINAPARDVVIELPAGGTIRGRVVEKGSSKAIANFQAGVSASRSGGGMMMMAPPLLKSFTSEDGSFVLENVPPGAMNLVATAAGYSPARLNVEVQEGKTLSDVVLELEQGVRLTGKVTGPNGAALADANVMVQPSPNGSFAMTGSIRRATTDANGEYTLDGLTPGEETIQVSHQKYSGVSRNVTLKGRETKLDVQLEGGMKLTGVVVTDSGAPVAEADVDAHSAGGGSYSARTNASGTFEMESVRPGRYRFSAAKSGFMEGRLDDVDISSGPVRIVLQTGGTIYGRVTGVSEADLSSVTVTARGSRGTASAPADPQGNFRIEGVPSGTVSVSASVQPRDFANRRTSSTQTVEMAAGGSQQVNIDFRGDVLIRGRVTRNGKPLGGANVSFFPRKSNAQASVSTSADEQGMYSASGLDEGEYNVMVSDIQRYSTYNTTYNVRGSATFDIEFKAGSVRGRVIDAGTNEPVENANVQFRSTGSAPQDMRGMRTAATDSNGVFTLDFVHAGAYVITASRDGYGNATLETTISDSGRDDLELKISRNEGVRMTVVDLRDGRPLNAQVVVFDMQGRQIFDTRANFRFGDSSTREVRLPLSPGSYTATVWVSDYAPQHISLSSPSTPRIAVTPGGTIVVRSKHNERRRMRLIDANGVAYPRFSPAGPATRDLPPGTVPLEHIAPGAYTLVLLNDDETPAATQPVLVREGETVTVEL